MTRRKYSTVLEIQALCAVCFWRQHGKNAVGLAAQHHDKTGHIVDVVQTIQTTYGVSLESERPAPAPLPEKGLF